MQIIDTALPEVKIIVPDVFGDQRGYFFESWNEEKYLSSGINCRWVQDNESRSKYGVLRGLHYQAAPYTQAKLVRVIEGKVLDVTVDIRKGSPSFGKYAAVELSAENKYQLFIPRGFAHGFVVLSESVIFAYKCDNAYMPSHERGIAFDDPALGIDWQIAPDKLILSAKDMKNPLFADAEFFDYNSREYLQ
ncbi:MAG: dTDP-4-dehydrorhamnose 3,5-epimerase [Lentisphaeria bacterium]|nr:dTDP-4-dehydrorhamnose 3,5-epimerase [Lentisphaeria bacterium]